MTARTFTITGITCDACVKVITRRLSKLAGVTNVQVELSGKTHIESPKGIPIESIQNALSETHYTVMY